MVIRCEIMEVGAMGRKKKGYRMLTYLTPELRKLLKKLSYEQERTMSDIIREALVEYFERRGLLGGDNKGKDLVAERGDKPLSKESIDENHG